MKVIFLQDVPRVGRKHEIKEVSDGYASNMLLPKKWAVVATPKAVAELERAQTELRVERAIQDDLLAKSLEEIKGKTITIKSKANEKGHLFSAIHKKEILEAMKKDHRIEIDEEFIILDKPIKEVGEHDIPIEIRNKKTSFKLLVQSI